MTLEAAVFDYAGVMTAPIAGTRFLPDDHELDRKALASLLVREFVTAHDDSLWARVERGEAPLAAFERYVDEHVPGAGPLFDPTSPLSIIHALQLRDDMVAMVRQLRAAGVRVALCTNNVVEWRPVWRGMLPEGLFELVVDSSEVRMRKPEAGIYRLVLDELGVAAPRALFVDDFPQNVEGARAVGMQALLAGAGQDPVVEVPRRFGLDGESAGEPGEASGARPDEER